MIDQITFYQAQLMTEVVDRTAEKMEQAAAVLAVFREFCSTRCDEGLDHLRRGDHYETDPDIALGRARAPPERAGLSPPYNPRRRRQSGHCPQPERCWSLMAMDLCTS